MEVEIERSEKFAPLFDLPEGTNVVVCIGGRGGMKTYEVSKFIAVSATIHRKRCVILRDELTRIKESILNEIWARYDTANENGVLDLYYSKNETELKEKRTGNTLIYTKGFRASNNQKAAFLKGDSDIDIAVIEEAEDIRDQDKFNTFADSLRKKGALVVIMLNTPDLGHWICKRYFKPVQVEDGYYELIPKEIPGFFCIQTSYKDNPYLPQHIVDNYEGYGNPNHHLYNYHYYMTAILGYASTGRKGQILTKVKWITLAEYLALPYKEIYAQDFGPASPAATLGGKFHNNRLYFRGMNYKGLNALQIALKYIEWGFTSADEIVADPADKQACNLLSDGFTSDDAPQDILDKYPKLRQGFNVFRAPKGRDSISNDIDILDSMELYCVEDGEEAENIKTEIMSWVYAQDKWGNYTNEAIDNFNHYMDCLRYLVQHRNRGDYGISRSN